ncbi:MAG: phosphotransferase [Quadrisphaera sp.]
MDSPTKNRQPLPVLRALTARAYGSTEVAEDGDETWVRELGHGLFNAVYRIRLRSGRLVVLKVAPSPHLEVMTYERDAMATELVALELLRERTGVPVPEVHAVDTSRDLCDADCFLMEHVDGEDLDVVRDRWPLADVSACLEQVGALTHEVGTVRGPGFGRLVGPVGHDWTSTFLGMLDDVIDDGERRRVDLGCGAAELRAVALAGAPALGEVNEPRLVAWDLWPGNCRVRDGRVVAVVDHERAFYGDPLAEFGFAGLETGWWGDTSTFVRGYGWAPTSAAQLTRRRLYDLHLALVQVVETAYRGQIDGDQADWARARVRDCVRLLA